MRFSPTFLTSVFTSALMLLAVSASPAHSQTDGAAPSFSQPEGSAIPSRVLARVDDSRLTQLRGNLHPMARAEFDRGAVASSFPMEGMILVLKRSPEQEAALEKFMTQQTDEGSSNYHHWLEPEEFGALYGPSDYDIQAVTVWLSSHGFSVDEVTKGKTFIRFSGTAAEVQSAFHTEIHRFEVKGANHVANANDPFIPEALSPVVAGIASLNDFFAKPLHRDLGNFRRDMKTGKWTPERTDVVGKPLYTVPGTDPTFELVSPYDFATIYNLLPLWSAGITGAGQSVAIAGRSDVSLADVRTFRSSFGLPANDPDFIVNGPDPGVPSADDKVENTLDVEWSGAVAKNATIKFVTTKSTSTSDGASASAMYIIDNKVAPVMSFSYGACELDYGSSGNSFNNSLWQQGAAEGISEFVASGDQGSAACDGGGTPPDGATNGLQVSGSSSTPYDIAVGGTDFNWVNLSTSYWKSSNAANGSSALSYIPEIPWNGTCASLAVDEYVGATAAGDDQEETCQTMLNGGFDLQYVSVVGGTGGKSACTTPSGTTPSTCAGGYAKPSWQTGTGVPADGKRDVPDVSLFAASGGLNDAYAICDSQSTPCNYTNTNDALGQAVGGTSVASPAMAGIMALVNQKTGAAQGNANPKFYALAAKDNRSSCNSVSVKGGNACSFYDITTDNNAVPCIPGTLDCNVAHSGDSVGILSGYKSTTGFDLTTGLGSVNANNLVNNWPASTTGSKTVTVSPTSLTFASTKVGSTTAAQVVTIKNTGTAAVTLTSETITGTNATSFVKSATTCSSSLAVGASCTVSVEFKPTAAGSPTASLSAADNATGSPQLVTLKGTATSVTVPPTATLSPTSLTFASTAVGSTTAAQVVTLKNTSTTTAMTISSITYSGTNATSFVKSATTCGSSLAVGKTCTISTEFKPTVAGALTATLAVADNATGTPQKVTLKGTGTAPKTTLSATTLTFPATVIGVTSAKQVLTLTNSGTAVMDIKSIALTGGNTTSFAIASKTCGSTLAAAAKCTITLDFKPTAAGALTTDVAITDNAAGSPQKVVLKGTGTAPKATLSATTLTFASTKEGATSASQILTLTNSGTAVMDISSIAVAGTNASSFKIASKTCGSTLAAAAKCTVTVDFKPVATGTLTGDIAITDNAAGSPQKVTLKGTGAAS